MLSSSFTADPVMVPVSVIAEDPLFAVRVSPPEAALTSPLPKIRLLVLPLSVRTCKRASPEATSSAHN